MLEFFKRAFNRYIELRQNQAMYQLAEHLAHEYPGHTQIQIVELLRSRFNEHN